MFSRYVNSKYAVMVNSGTAALHLCLAAIDLQPEDEVITTTYTFAATAEVIEYFSAKPVFVDKKNKIWKASRRMEVYKENKVIAEYSWEQQKHPIGYSEISQMISSLNLSVISVWGNIIEKTPFTSESSRATFWLKKD